MWYESLKEAYNRGYAAGYEGVLFTYNDNPYNDEEDEEAYNAWNEGFDEGNEDAYILRLKA